MVVLRTKPSNSEQEVIQLKQELNESRGKSIEPWINHDKAMMASEIKIRQLEEQLQERELQLARRKLSRLTSLA